MKVICIDDNFNKGRDPKFTGTPKVGEICTVFDRLNFYGVECYGLEGYTLEPTCTYWEAENFAPLSTIDETTFKRELWLIGTNH